MYIKNLTLKNFRCFASKKVAFDKRLILIQGANGSGKTSLIEALHFACYLRSFRTHLHKDMIRLNDDEKHFFIDVGFVHEQDGTEHQITVGTSLKEKVVKFDTTSIKTYKEILDHYRVITFSQHDLFLVQGAPEVRRAFLNQALMLSSPTYIETLKKYKQVVAQRNKLLTSLSEGTMAHSMDQLRTWSRQMWDLSRCLQAERREYLALLEAEINTHSIGHFEPQTGQRAGLSIAIRYKEKMMHGHETFDQFWAEYAAKHLITEVNWNRSLFGAHLDDFVIEFESKRARVFASRGQQKLVVFLIKVAQLTTLKHPERCVLLLDDFLTDFDTRRFNQCIAFLAALPHQYQIFITSPLREYGDVFNDLKQDVQVISL